MSTITTDVVPSRETLTLHRYGMLGSENLSPTAKQGFGRTVDEHRSRVSDALDATKGALEQISVDPKLSVMGRHAARKDLLEKAAANVEKINSETTGHLKGNIAQMRSRIVTEPPPIKNDDLASIMAGREIRDSFRSADPPTRLARALAAARSGDTRTIGAVLSDPLDAGSRILSDSGPEQVKSEWSKAAYPQEHAKVAAAEESLNAIISNAKTAVNGLPQM